MHIGKSDLKKLILQVARQEFGGSEFARRSLMDAVETRLRSSEAWEITDDLLSRSSGLKSRGLANIDWRITDLKRSHHLSNTGRDRWKLKT